MSDFKPFQTVEEAVEYFHTLPDDSDDYIDICQLPPEENGCLTDEEDVNEDTFEPVLPADVCGQIEVSRKKEDNELYHDGAFDPDVPSTSHGKPGLKRKRKSEANNIQYRWRKNESFEKNLRADNIESICELHPELDTLSPAEIFHKFIPKEYLLHLANMTALYALQKGESLAVDENDIGQFFGLLLFSGYHQVPAEDLYWSTQEDLSVPIVSTVMPRNRFRKLKKYFHIIDNNTLAPGDKMGKISPFYEELEKNLQQFGIFHSKLSIDESMVPYYGHHSAKMFIRGKPIRFGYKIWMLCSNSGYPYAMKIYSGKSSEMESSPLGTRVVWNLLSCVETPEKYEIFFDNFFSSYKLLRDLPEKGFKATGTIREFRTGRCPLKSPKEAAKWERGNFDYRNDGHVYICRWKDSAVVTIASNYATHEPLGKTKRFCRAQKKRTDISQPHLIKMYNEGMGGVDLLDRLLGSYRPVLRSKKWYWNLFSNALNMAVVAGWILHLHLHKGTPAELSHLNFRREVTLCLFRMKAKINFIPGPHAHRSESLRQTDAHYLVPSTQGRCAVCQKNTIKQCFECGKRLHEKCFPNYHGQ